MQYITIDCEATGLDISRDRIISLAILASDKLSYLFNPEMNIPAEATAIHGITDEHVANCPTFEMHASEIHDQLVGKTIVGFNHLNFDVPLIWEELFRSGINWDTSKSRFIDVCNIFKKMEPRTLAGAVRFYLNRDHEGAHGAMADAQATAQVLDAQRNRYFELPTDIEELSKFSQMDNRIDLAGKIVRNADGHAVYNFGKSKGRKVTEDAGFGRWMLDKDFSANTKLILENLLNGKQS